MSLRGAHRATKQSPHNKGIASGGGTPPSQRHIKYFDKNTFAPLYHRLVPRVGPGSTAYLHHNPRGFRSRAAHCPKSRPYATTPRGCVTRILSHAFPVSVVETRRSYTPASTLHLSLHPAQSPGQVHRHHILFRSTTLLSSGLYPKTDP